MKHSFTSRIVMPDGTIIPSEAVMCVHFHYDYFEQDLDDQSMYHHYPFSECAMDEATGFSDSANTPIFENDLFLFTHPYMSQTNGEREPITAVVVWDQYSGSWMLNRQDSFRVPLARYARKGKVTGRKA